MTGFTELWLLANRRGIDLVSAHALVHMPTTLPSLPDGVLHLEALLPRLAEELVTLVDSSVPVAVFLHRSLPEDWQRVAWEKLTHRGQPLFGKVIFCRYATFEYRPMAELAGTLHAHSLWPDTPLVAGILSDAIHEGRMRLRPAGVDRPLNCHDWRGVWALAIIGHGSDAPDVAMLDVSGAVWPLPHLAHWPPVVFLLACDADSSLVRDAGAMLNAGAHTVVVGEGLLDLRASLEALSDLALGMATGGNLARNLAEMQQSDPRLGGVRQWIVCGRLPGAMGHSQLDRWTLRSLVEKGDLTAAPVAWRDSHDIEFGARGEADLLDEIKHTRCWPITESWALPQGLYLTGIYDRSTEAGLRKRHARLPDALRRLMPHKSDLALAQSLRRRGETVAALRALLHAMAEVEVMDGEDRLRCLYTFFDLLLDLHLPGAADAVRHAIQSQMCVRDEPALCALDHFWQDRESTWHWRSGETGPAYALLVHKRAQAKAMGEDGYRELARLLWLAGWAGHADAPALLREAESILGRRQIATLGKPGNNDFKYLFRSCALARWRLDRAGELSEEICKRLVGSLSDPRLDPGANGTSILVAALSDPGMDWPVSTALHRLEEANYWLESAYWASLHQLDGQVNQSLERLDAVRHKYATLMEKHKQILVYWVRDADIWLTAFGQERKARAVLEREALCGGDEPWNKGLML